MTMMMQFASQCMGGGERAPTIVVTRPTDSQRVDGQTNIEPARVPGGQLGATRSDGQLVVATHLCDPGTQALVAHHNIETATSSEGLAPIDVDGLDAPDDILLRFESMASGGAISKRPAASLKRPVASVKRPAAASDVVVKRPAAKMLGCSRCRGGSAGCLSCRNPNFNGKRFRG